tara:strand:- start:890 stop:1870 length:981 start_codon:yes stop_codon:yes gene_type:complete
MNTIILALVVLLTVGTTHAYAEESIVQVPFVSHGQSCTFNELSIEYQCTWQGVRDVFTIEDLKEFKSVLSNEIYDQELARLTEQALAEIAVEQAKLSPNELTIQEIEDKLDRGVATARDSVLMNLLKELSTCRQGMDERTQHIQTAREFEVSDFQLWSVNNVKYDGVLGKLAMAIEECQAQKQVYKISVGYQNFDFGSKQYSLNDKFTSDIQAIPYDKWTATNDDINKSLICDNNAHNQQYKQQFGCVMLYDGLDEESIRAQNEIRFGTDGVIGYKNKVLTDYSEFLSNYGGREATIEDKKTQELISEPIANAWKEDHTFYKNNLD